MPDPDNDDERDIAAIRAAFDAGITHIDTAEIYAAGHTEELVGEAIADLPREKLFITSKVATYHLRYDQVLAAAEGSLKRLGLKYLDLYLIHGPDPEVPLKETMRAMAKLREQGLIRNIGVSNFIPELIAEAQKFCSYRIVNNQINYSLEARGHDEVGTLEYCAKNQILVMAYRPLAKGVFSVEGQQMLQKLGQKYQKPPLAVALNWVLGKPNVVALVKTSNPQHLRENLVALGWRLDSEDEQALDERFPAGETMGVGSPARTRRPPVRKW